MAITSSAKKAIRASARKRVFNMRRKNALAHATKAFARAVAAGKAKEAQALLPAAYRAIDKAAKQHVVSKNAAARKKSHLAHALKDISK
ncbi:30S ribosomal protein S20 [Candidatus Kaiserbacteria bacterium]|nr:30S ribosomal protein S20 [Candidatus Kaiserbacteria bacterium]